MALTQISTGGIKDDAVTDAKLPANSVGNSEMKDDAVGVAELSATGTASSSTFLRGDNSWVTPTDTNTQLAFANDANNRVITGDGSGGLNGEANLTFDGTLLTVNGATSDTPLIINSTNAGGPHLRFQQDGSTKHFVGCGTGIGGLGDKDDFAIRAYDNIFLATNNTSTARLTIDANGNVGIGTSNPVNKLHCVSSDYQTARFESSAADANGAYIELYANSSSPADDDISGLISFKGNDSGGNETTYAQIRSYLDDVTDGTEDGILTFHTRDNGSFGERLRIKSDGEVTIGSGNLGTSMSEFGSGTGGLTLDDIGSSHTALRLSHGSDDTYLVQASNNNFYISQYGTGSMIFGVGSSGNERLRIDSDGHAIFKGVGDAANGSIEVESTDPFIRLNDTNGVTDKKKWDIRAVGGSGYEQLAFRTASDDNSTFLSKVKMWHNGNLEVVDGNIKVANTHGIDFSAQTSTSASGAQVSGAGHEEFNHYEEGQWTPTPSGTGQSYSWRKGRYTRIGNTVFYWFDVSWTGMTGSMTDGSITGLPFTSTALTTQAGYGAVSLRSMTGLESDMRVYGNSTYVANAYLQLQHFNSSGTVDLTDFLASGRVTGEGFYYVNNAY